MLCCHALFHTMPVMLCFTLCLSCFVSHYACHTVCMSALHVTLCMLQTMHLQKQKQRQGINKGQGNATHGIAKQCREKHSRERQGKANLGGQWDDRELPAMAGQHNREEQHIARQRLTGKGKKKETKSMAMELQWQAYAGTGKEKHR